MAMEKGKVIDGHDSEETRTVKFRGEAIVIHRHADGLWRDSNDCIYAFPDDASQSWDTVVRCGVWPFVLPADDPLTECCAKHDAQYSNQAWQISHNRSEADAELRDSILKTQKGWRRYMAYPFYGLVRIFGGLFWSVKETEDK